MSNFNDIVDLYIASWNEADAARRGDLIARTWTEDATYVDPQMSGAGHTGIGALIDGIHGQFPNYKFRLAGNVDGHNDRVRFTWTLGPSEDDTIARGTDFCLVAPDGRLKEVTGFLDFVALPG